MRAILGSTLAALVVCFGASADDKKDTIDAKKLVGKWEPKEQKEQKEGHLFLMEFLKDGQLVVVRTTDEKESKFTVRAHSWASCVNLRDGRRCSTA